MVQMMQEQMEAAPDAETPADESTEQGGDAGSAFIELEIKADGTMMVSLESGHDEEAETPEQEQAEPAGTPAKNIEDACRIIKTIAKQVMGAAPTPQAQGQEDAAYQAEMGNPAR